MIRILLLTGAATAVVLGHSLGWYPKAGFNLTGAVQVGEWVAQGSIGAALQSPKVSQPKTEYQEL